MTALEQVREWLKTFPGYDKLGGFHVDYTDSVPANAGVFPSGLVEVERRPDILGGCVVRNQYNFALYCVFEKVPGDDDLAALNAEWVTDFQLWVQEQSIKHLAPTFGSDPLAERITAQNGALYQASEEGTALYMVQIAASFVKTYERTV